MNRQHTSASNLYRRRLCPASSRLEKGLPETTSDDASEGIMLHACLSSGTQHVSLTLDQEGVLDFCRKTVSDLVARFFPGKEPVRQVEVPLDFGDIQEFGHADLLCVSGSVAMVVDYKFGRNPVDHAEANDQLAAYAVMVAETCLSKTVFAVIIQPRADDRDARVTIAEYSFDSIKAANTSIVEVLHQCDMPDQKPVAGKHCQYCRAKATCPALQKEAMELTIIDQSAVTVSNVAGIYSKCKLVEKHLAALKAECFKVVLVAKENGIETPGIGLTEGRKVRKITDAQKAFESVRDVLSPEEFIVATDVSVASLQETYVKKLKALAPEGTKITVKSGKEQLENALTKAGVLETKTTAPSLELTHEKDTPQA